MFTSNSVAFPPPKKTKFVSVPLEEQVDNRRESIVLFDQYRISKETKKIHNNPTIQVRSLLSVISNGG